MKQPKTVNFFMVGHEIKGIVLLKIAITNETGISRKAQVLLNTHKSIIIRLNTYLHQ